MGTILIRDEEVMTNSITEKLITLRKKLDESDIGDPWSYQQITNETLQELIDIEITKRKKEE